MASSRRTSSREEPITTLQVSHSLSNSSLRTDLRGYMKSPEHRVGRIAFVLAVSIVGLAASASLLINPASFSLEMPGRREVVVLFYGLVCISGIIAVLLPVTCSGFLGIRASPTENLRNLEARATRIFGVLLLHGHHPPEPQAMIHELHFSGKSFCANCFGLLTGATLSLVAIASFALWGWPAWADIRLAYVSYSAGIAAVILGFVQSPVSNIGARARFTFAALFVVGTCLMLIATDVLTENFTADLFVLLLSVFWLLSRISLSHLS